MDDNHGEGVITMADLGVQLGVMQQQITDIVRRLDNMEELTASIHNMAISITKLTDNTEAMKEHVERISTDVDELKTKPAKRWESVVAALIAGVVGAIIGHFFK